MPAPRASVVPAEWNQANTERLTRFRLVRALDSFGNELPEPLAMNSVDARMRAQSDLARSDADESCPFRGFSFVVSESSVNTLTFCQPIVAAGQARIRSAMSASHFFTNTVAFLNARHGRGD